MEEIYDRRLLIQDVIDRLIHNPQYRESLIEFNQLHPIKIRVNNGHRVVEKL
jgi:hypothetical protein